MPNELPLNWCECKFEDVLDYEQPTRYIVSNTDYQEQGIAVLTAGKSFILGYTDEKDGIFDASKETVIIFDDFTTASKLVDFPFKVKSSAMKILHAKKDININFLYYLMQTIHYESDTHKRYWISEYAKQTLNLPPLAEQERIVEKIEALFQDIDEGVERLKSAQAQIKQYRQSVLKSAFEGKLYKTTDWKEVQLKDVCEKITDGSHFSPKQVSNGCYPYITVKDVRKDIIDFDAAKRIDKKQYELLLKSGCKPYKGDVLFSKDGTVGKVVLVDYEKEFVILSSLAILRPKKELKSEFLFYVLKSPKFLAEAINKKTGVAIRRIILDTLKRISISFPSDISEQQRIVEEIEKRFAVADELEKVVNEGLEKADKLKQSILKKAFEGKLVAQDPNDELASVLLERIKKEKQTLSKTKGKKIYKY
ncbi:MAG: restriction endonuclease subunit S [Alphaproteobacteria bacterium]|nr:restriction endonuclease subunit S [Alphaproteobacteria bacterium]